MSHANKLQIILIRGADLTIGIRVKGRVAPYDGSGLQI